MAEPHDLSCMRRRHVKGAELQERFLREKQEAGELELRRVVSPRAPMHRCQLHAMHVLLCAVSSSHANACAPPHVH